MVQKLLGIFQDDFERVLRLYVKLDRGELTSRWNWSFWKNFKGSETREINTNDLIERAFALIFCKSFKMHPLDMSSLKFNFRYPLKYRINGDASSLKRLIESIEERIEYKFLTKCKSQFSKDKKLLLEFLDKIVEEENKQSSNRIIKKELEEDKINNFIENFKEEYRKQKKISDYMEKSFKKIK